MYYNYLEYKVDEDTDRNKKKIKGLLDSKYQGIQKLFMNSKFPSKNRSIMNYKKKRVEMEYIIRMVNKGILRIKIEFISTFLCK